MFFKLLQTPYRNRNSNKLLDIVDDFDIGSRISLIVQDQATNMLSSLDILDSERG